MKKFFSVFLSILTAISSFFLAGCNSEGDYFKIEGRFKNLTQGQFYVYSSDGGLDKVDTIQLQDGRFAYQTFITEPHTFLIVFPNFSEQPVFGEPSRTAKIEGDATHLIELEISGTKDNKLMTDFRKHTSTMSPPQVAQAIEDFVAANPQSAVTTYIISKYLVRNAEPDYAKASKLLNKVIAARPGDKVAKRLRNQVDKFASSAKLKPLPKFKATTIDGKAISNATFRGKVGIIHAFASWNYDSQNINQRLSYLNDEHPGQLAIVSISLDPDKKVCRRNLQNSTVTWDVVCDGEMWNSPLVSTLGIFQLPENIIIDKQGKIAARTLNYDEIKNEVERLLK